MSMSYDKSLPKCPKCGATAFISKDVVDGMYFGWSVGCPRYRLNDGIHGVTKDTPRQDRYTIFGLDSQEKAKAEWIKRVKILEKNLT